MPAPPIGIHPSAYSAMCANSFGPAAPPISTGGPSGSRRLRPRPRRRQVHELAVVRRDRRRATTPSSRARARARASRRLFMSTPWSAASSSFQPNPMPSTKRPPVSMSSVATPWRSRSGRAARRGRCRCRRSGARSRWLPSPARPTGRACACTPRAARRRRSAAASAATSGCACAPGTYSDSRPRTSIACASVDRRHRLVGHEHRDAESHGR